MAQLITYSDLPALIQTRLTKWGFSTTEATRDAEITKAEVNVQARVNSQLVRRYPADVPFTSVTLPAVIKSVLIDLLIVELAGGQQAIGESYQQKADKAVLLVEAIADGTIDVYSEFEDAVLGDYSTDFGMATDTDATLTDEDYRVFPRPAGDRPANMDYTVDSND